ALTPGLGTVRLAGAEPLVAALFTVWGLRNPEATIVLIIVPVTGLVVALLSAATVWWSYGVYHGLFVALGSAGIGALYLSQGHRLHHLLKRFRPDPRDKAARQRDKRFQQIMEKSGLRLVDDEEKRPR
ncbi:MAG: hypothetical protein HUU35_15495, partial [Armatimonadetes bacterium]|nr:hypothetical protein [Armatimonadota bacterium]